MPLYIYFTIINVVNRSSLSSLPISRNHIMAEAACCTCASLLSNINPEYDEKTEKPVAQDRRLNCCGRVICGKCITVRERIHNRRNNRDAHLDLEKHTFCNIL